MPSRTRKTVVRRKKLAKYPRYRVIGGRRYVQRGNGKAWEWIKDKARKVGKFVKDSKLISSALTAGAPLLGPLAPYALASGAVTRAIGFGPYKSRTTKRKTRRAKK